LDTRDVVDGEHDDDIVDVVDSVDRDFLPPEVAFVPPPPPPREKKKKKKARIHTDSYPVFPAYHRHQYQYSLKHSYSSL
jgi:hypothetical protein